MLDVTYRSTCSPPLAATGAARLAEEKAVTRATEILAKCILLVQVLQFLGMMSVTEVRVNQLVILEKDLGRQPSLLI